MVINQSVKYKNSDPLTIVFGALADPTRRAILAQLSRKEASVGELAAPFKMSLPAISKHLKVLEQAGLISKTKHAQLRACHLEAKRLQEATEWLQNYRQFWEDNLDGLEIYLKQIQDNNKEL